MLCTVCAALRERETKVLANERGVEMANQSEQAWIDWYVEHETIHAPCPKHEVELAASLLRNDRNKAGIPMQLCRSCEYLFPRLFGETQCMHCREGKPRELKG